MNNEFKKNCGNCLFRVIPSEGVSLCDISIDNYGDRKVVSEDYVCAKWHHFYPVPRKEGEKYGCRILTK